MPPTASRIATIVMSAAAIGVLAVALSAKWSRGPRSVPDYRTEGAPFASGIVEGVLVFSTAAQARVASTVIAEPDGCDVPAPAIPAVVWIDGPVSGAAPARRGAQIELGGCGFEPVVGVAMADTRLRVRTDSRDHRIQAWLDGVRVFDATEGGTAEVRLVSPGIWRVRCAAGHPGEEAWVVATRTPYAKVVEPGRGFSIEAVPEGRWTLVAWHPAVGMKHVDAEVFAKKTTRAEIDF